MKKLLSLLLAGTMLFSLAACGNDAEEKDDSKKNKFDAVDNGDFGGENDGFVNEEEVSVQIGDYITFGKYEQDNDTSNGKEDIEWLVLDKEGDRVLVISKYALDCKPYGQNSVTWETCVMRSWLNKVFIYQAFTSSEMSKIPTVTVTADANPANDTDPGNDTQDKMFLLSIDEFSNFYNSFSEHMPCLPTEYAISQGCVVSDRDGYEGNCNWWLRTPGYGRTSASYVTERGRYDFNGEQLFSENDIYAVRPAMWIEL